MERRTYWPTRSDESFQSRSMHGPQRPSLDILTFCTPSRHRRPTHDHFGCCLLAASGPSAFRRIVAWIVNSDPPKLQDSKDYSRSPASDRQARAASRRAPARPFRPLTCSSPGSPGSDKHPGICIIALTGSLDTYLTAHISVQSESHRFRSQQSGFRGLVTL